MFKEIKRVLHNILKGKKDYIKKCCKCGCHYQGKAYYGLCYECLCRKYRSERTIPIQRVYCIDCKWDYLPSQDVCNHEEAYTIVHTYKKIKRLGIVQSYMNKDNNCTKYEAAKELNNENA